MIPRFGRQHRPVPDARSWYPLCGRPRDGVCVDLDRGLLGLWFGRWRLATLLDNIESVEVGGPYRARPISLGRRSRTDRGLIVATATARGATLGFDRPVPAIHATGVRRRVPRVSVTVTAPAALVEQLRRYRSSTSSSR